MKKYTYVVIAISFLAMVAGTAVADDSVSKPQTGNSSDLNYVNGIWTANPYPF